MVVVVKLKHVEERKGGTKRFFRRWPKDVRDKLPSDGMKVTMKAREGAAMVSEQAKLVREFDHRVAIARKETTPAPREQHRMDKAEADQMVSEVVGLEGQEDDRRDVLAESLVRIGYRPEVVRLVLDGAAKPPSVTLEDARQHYLKEVIGADQQKQNRLDRVCRRLVEQWGPLDQVTIAALTPEQVRDLRDVMLSSASNKGKPLTPATVKRELGMAKAMVNEIIEALRLERELDNPFRIKMPAEEIVSGYGEERESLPADVLSAMRAQLLGHCATPELVLIWRIMTGTGARLGEVTGLEIGDVVLGHEFPHVHLRFNSIRRLKNKSSIRKVPLSSDALAAARGALVVREGAASGEPLFPRYGKPRGADGASQALMKHLRKVTTNDKHTNHSLRHCMKDWLVSADVPDLVQQILLGHKREGTGNTAYGSERARLGVCSRALLSVDALGVIPEWG
ncbi:tyrosine-type recombinase/integrase [Tropicimonas sp. TH_r6]|uniref:site-specific integrase n=1 Tax=Tropicimonas sp. TH_r6 TaxID=3082085 RepID=UPI0029539007|nr:tyrosine-type recombinase/integrase [Tropicimonas sp. TH_r6]MDV7144086.1 tyrosine-type recombinase/integrase [Tropicimonas sp. TH_r6]